MDKYIKKFKSTLRTTSPLFILIFLTLMFYVIFLTYLLIWGIQTSLKTVVEFNDNVLGPTIHPTLVNFKTIFENFYIIVTIDGVKVPKFVEHMLLNTLLYAGGNALLSTFVPCIVAYVVTRFNYKFNSVIKGIVLVTMVLPIVGSTGAAIQFSKAIGTYDSIIGDWIGKISFLGMYFLIFCAAFETLPKDYIEAAYMDGASELSLFFKIMFPMVGAIFSTIFMMSFIGYWNDYQTPLMWLPSHPTLATGVFQLSRSNINELNNVPARMAGCTILLVPILIVFISFKNKLMSNITIGGVKE